MKVLVTLSCLVAMVAARPGLLLNGALPLNGVATYAAAAPVQSQYHAQDELGQYSYGYAGGPSAKQEVRTADGITRGGFSYVDSNGHLQSRSYVSDPINGFRVAASDLPVGPSPVIAAAPAVVAPAVAAPVAIAAPAQDTVEVVAAKAQLPVATPVVAARTIAHAPVAVPAPVAVAAPSALHSQYHAQDELGQYSYGYAGGLSSKNEHKTFDGITRGAFSYVDAHGLVQSRSYVSDPVNGFRVAASDLPVGPAPVAAAPIVPAAPIVASSPILAAPAAPVVGTAPAAPVFTAPAAPVFTAPAAPVFTAPAAPAFPAASPVAVSDDAVVVDSPADTPEVAIAKAQHFAAHQEARARLAY